MAIGDLIRDLRLSKGLSQLGLGEALNTAAGREDAPAARDMVKRWERGKVVPGRYWLAHLASVFGVPSTVLEAEATLTRVNRRAFMSLTALAATHGKAATELVSSLAGADAGPLTTVQTTHGTDLVIAALVDRPTVLRLRGWMEDGSDAVLRVNSAGILAKMPGQDEAIRVARSLRHDSEALGLYKTAVLARTCGLDFAQAALVVADPFSMPAEAPFMASRLAAEARNPRDAGARWCSAELLRDLSPLLIQEQM
ncbi:helix-turn-helix domain-containing protein [Streptomyces sp. NPDC002698]|uniref:helix-turn-helix domain-containing protein n=1 Tax=Streptomyces sp. NPDC002698 TaxID=3364660 RepID=UPI0036C62EB9